MKKKLFSLLCVALCVNSFAAGTGLVFRWGDTDVRYPQGEAPAVFQKKAFAYPAWKGEKVNAEAVIWTPSELSCAKVTASDLACGKNVIPASCVTVSYIRYVIGDELAPGYGQCGKRDTVNFKKIVVPDMLDVTTGTMVGPGLTQPVWMSLKVPVDAAPGVYRGKVTLSADGSDLASLPLEIEVKDRVMPQPSEWKFHLDLWQNPYAVARWFGVEPWSNAHFAAMRPVMQTLADAGQKVITVSVLDRPWNGQTYDPFGPMVTKIRRADGTWLYDYTIFDKWVSFMMSLGIDRQINCYSLVPWKMSFDYYDQATNTLKAVECQLDSPAFVNYWSSFLKDFQEHLRAKGWLEKTNIAMDERPLEAMQAAIALVKSAAPEIGIALAGSYHEEIQADIDDLCITSKEEFPASVRAQRREDGLVSTYYTCCAEGYPNTFMASQPAEGAWIGWYALAHNFDGYLRWAYNSWTEDAAHDARFRTWAAGDCYLVYPADRSSIRMEKVTEGIRDYEKATILMEEWKAAGTKAAAAKLSKLQAALDAFEIPNIPETGAAAPVAAARRALATE